MPTTLITGASSGIGLELAKVSAAEGNDQVIVARRKELLKGLADELREKHGIEVTIIVADLSHPHGARQVFDELEKQAIVIDILINNAGFGSFGHFVDAETDNQVDMIQVNITALTELTHLLLPGMMKRQSGKILNVASTAAFQPGPLMAVYFATKAYVLSFSAALSNELKGTGITVTALCPGPTASGFQKVAFTKSKGVFSGKLPSSATVATYGYAAMKKGQLIAIPGLRNKLGALGGRLLPIPLVARIVRAAQD